MADFLALDLFCGAGGAAAGLQRAGFRVVGIDRVVQTDYPGDFLQADALLPPVRLADFDLVWASPPCQAYSRLRFFPHPRPVDWPELIPQTRALLAEHPMTVMENVMGAPLRRDLTLWGAQFGLLVHKRRIFEVSFDVAPPFLRWGQSPVGLVSATGKDADVVIPTRRRRHGLPPTTGVDELAAALGIGHIVSGTAQERRRALSNAIPPCYAEWIALAARDLLVGDGPAVPVSSPGNGCLLHRGGCSDGNGGGRPLSHRQEAA